LFLSFFFPCAGLFWRVFQSPGGVGFADVSGQRLHLGLLPPLIDYADGQVGDVVVVEVDFAVGSFFEIRVLPQRLGEAGFAQLLGVDDDVVLSFGFEVGVLEFRGGDLQAGRRAARRFSGRFGPRSTCMICMTES